MVVAVAVSLATAGAAAGIIGGAGNTLLGSALGGINATLGASSLSIGAVAGSSAGGFVAGAIGGAVGSIASQAVGVATGIQGKFSWTSVASSALAGGLGGGGFLEKSGAFLQGAGANAISQAAGIALGPQSKFSWASVAAAGVGSWAGGKFGASKFGQALASSTFASQIGTGTASAIANAATRTALGDGNFGDNIRAAIPDVIGQALGGAIGARISAALNATTQAEIELRTTLVSQNAEGFRARFGDMSEVDDYEQALLGVAASPGDKRLQREYNRATRAMLEANSSDPGVADFLQKIHPDTNIVNAAADEDGQVMEKVRVTSDRDFLFGSTVDGAGIWVGEVQHEIGGKVGQFIEENPGVGIAIQIADGAFAVAAPAKYLGGMALDHFEEEASGFIASQMDGPNMWASDKAQAGGDGFVFSAGVLLGGLGGIASRRRGPDRPDYQPTRPSGRRGDIDVNLKGELSTVEMSTNYRQENEIARMFANEGYVLEQNPMLSPAQREQFGIPTRDPDYLIEGRPFDLYGPDINSTPEKIWRGIGEKTNPNRRQADRVIVDLRETAVTRGQLQSHIQNNPISGLNELRVITTDWRGNSVIRNVRR